MCKEWRRHDSRPPFFLRKKKMEEYSKEFLEYVNDIKQKFHPIQIPSIDVLFITYTIEQSTIQDEKPTNKKSKK